MVASFRFESAWHVTAPPAAVADAFVDLAAYPLWWPQVVAVADLGDDRAWVVCRSRLPYDLDLVLTAVRRTPPRLEVAVGGDLVGWVRIGLVGTPDDTRVRYEQEVTVPGVRGLLARPLRPLLVWNHEQMMRGLRTGLSRRLRPPADVMGSGRPDDHSP